MIIKSSTWIWIGALSGCISVVMGAFGAHALSARLADRALSIYQTAAQYQMYHSLALIAVGLWAAHGSAPSFLRWAGILFALGIVIFSGSLYALALTDIKILGAITPIGGVLFIAGWVIFAWSALK